MPRSERTKGQERFRKIMSNVKDTPHLELVEDNRGRWSWIYWEADGATPLAMSAISYDNLREAALQLKRIRKEIQNAPTVFYQNRRDTGRPVSKNFSDLNQQSHRR